MAEAVGGEELIAAILTEADVVATRGAPWVDAPDVPGHEAVTVELSQEGPIVTP